MSAISALGPAEVGPQWLRRSAREGSRPATGSTKKRSCTKIWTSKFFLTMSPLQALAGIMVSTCGIRSGWVSLELPWRGVHLHFAWSDSQGPQLGPSMEVGRDRKPGCAAHARTLKGMLLSGGRAREDKVQELKCQDGASTAVTGSSPHSFFSWRPWSSPSCHDLHLASCPHLDCRDALL